MNIEEIIKKKLKNAIIINSITEIEVNNIPITWLELLKLEKLEDKKKLILNYWGKAIEKLPRIGEIFNNCLISVNLVNDSNTVKLVYIFKVDDLNIVYEGRLPVENDSKLQIIPKDLKFLYQEIHNGWYEIISGGLGYLSLENITFLDKLEWGILDEIDKPKIDLSKTYYIFHNGASGYICIDISNIGHPEYLIWWADDKPKYNINFWSYFDAWVEIGME